MPTTCFAGEKVRCLLVLYGKKLAKVATFKASKARTHPAYEERVGGDDGEAELGEVQYVEDILDDDGRVLLHAHEV